MWEGPMMDTRCVNREEILKQDERVWGVILSYWTKTLSNMIITEENERAEVTVTSSKRGLKRSFTLKVKVEMDSNLCLARCY